MGIDMQQGDGDTACTGICRMDIQYRMDMGMQYGHMDKHDEHGNAAWICTWTRSMDKYMLQLHVHVACP